MRVIQTFWTNNEFKVENSGGWLSPEFHWMSWALSSLQLRKFYDDLTLYTDNNGKFILIDKLNYPYKNVQLSHNNLRIYPKNIWILGKIHTFSLQERTFMYVDGDVYIWKKLPELKTQKEYLFKILK